MLPAPSAVSPNTASRQGDSLSDQCLTVTLRANHIKPCTVEFNAKRHCHFAFSKHIAAGLLFPMILNLENHRVHASLTKSQLSKGVTPGLPWSPFSPLAPTIPGTPGNPWEHPPSQSSCVTHNETSTHVYTQTRRAIPIA